MIMQIVLNIPIIFLSVIVAVEMFFDYKKIPDPIKVILIFFIVVGNIVSFCYQAQERKEEQSLKIWADRANAEGLGAVSKSISDLKEKENPLKMREPETGSMFLDRNYLRLKGVLGTDHMVSGEHYLTIYFDEISKIPSFYSQAEWHETETLLYNNLINQIQSYFASHGTSNFAQDAIKEFSHERDKFIKAKDRQFKVESTK